MAARRQRKVKESTKKGFKTYRSAYYPGTEKLASNEMRITALGTGMPIYRPSQMSAGWFVELGNGDKFIFDIGTGCMRNFSALEVPYDEANKLFLTHLHTDHVGDFPYWYVGGWITRQSPVYIWGPSGMTRELGTKYCIEKLVEAYTWDITSRIGELPEPGREYHIEEFDYTQMNKIVYQKNGVTIRSFPQIHAIDGAVAYTLEWKGLKFVYGGDGRPSDLYVKYAKNSDLIIHECFMTKKLLMEKFGFSEQMAISVGTKVHTSPEQCGYVFDKTKPRLAVAYHFFNDDGTIEEVGSHLRKTYQGPLSLAKDLRVYNITPDTITERDVKYNEDNWPAKWDGAVDARKLPMGKKTEMSKWLTDHTIEFDD